MMESEVFVKTIQQVAEEAVTATAGEADPIRRWQTVKNTITTALREQGRLAIRERKRNAYLCRQALSAHYQARRDFNDPTAYEEEIQHERQVLQNLIRLSTDEEILAKHGYRRREADRPSKKFLKQMNAAQKRKGIVALVGKLRGSDEIKRHTNLRDLTDVARNFWGTVVASEDVARVSTTRHPERRQGFLPEKHQEGHHGRTSASARTSNRAKRIQSNSKRSRCGSRRRHHPLPPEVEGGRMRRVELRTNPTPLADPRTAHG